MPRLTCHCQPTPWHGPLGRRAWPRGPMVAPPPSPPPPPPPPASTRGRHRGQAHPPCATGGLPRHVTVTLARSARKFPSQRRSADETHADNDDTRAPQSKGRAHCRICSAQFVPKIIMSWPCAHSSIHLTDSNMVAVRGGYFFFLRRSNSGPSADRPMSAQSTAGRFFSFSFDFSLGFSLGFSFGFSTSLAASSHPLLGRSLAADKTSRSCAPPPPQSIPLKSKQRWAFTRTKPAHAYPLSTP